MESETLNEQINSLISEYAEGMMNLKASSVKTADTLALESEIETLKSELEKAEENLNLVTITIENAQKDMEDRNMGAIPNDPFFENYSKAKEECEVKVNELKGKIEEKEAKLSNPKDDKTSELERLNQLSEKIKKMIEFQKRNLSESLASVERVKAEMLDKAENGYDPTDREIAKMFVKDNNKKIRELKEKIESCDKLLERINEIANSLNEDKDLDSEKMKEYYDFFNNYNKEPIGQEDIEVDVTFNEDTGKYVVNCKSGKFELNPGKEFTEDELTVENINRLLKGFAGAVANNKVLVNANGKRYGGARVNNAAESIINASKSMAKVETKPNPDLDPNHDLDPNPNPDLDPDPKPDLDPKPNLDPKADTVVKKVIKTRNAFKLGVSIPGAVVAATALGFAGIPLLGVPVAAVAAYGAVNTLVDAAAAYKSRKVRNTLSKIADKYNLVTKVDRNTKSVYFCATDDLSTRITSEDLNNPNPEVRRVAQQLQNDLNKAFENDKRGIATPEQMKAYAEKTGTLTQRPPLEFCQKVTLDNVEAAYQQIGGVYSLRDRKKIFNGKVSAFFQQNAEKIATNFSKSMQPESTTEVIDADLKDVESLEKGQEPANENDKPETIENTEEKSQDNATSQETTEVKEEKPEMESEQQSQPVEEVTTIEEPQQEKTEPTPASNVDVDALDNAEDLLHTIPTEEAMETLNMLDGIDVGNRLKENSSNVHNANAYEQMAAELDGLELEAQDLGEEKGRTL